MPGVIDTRELFLKFIDISELEKHSLETDPPHAEPSSYGTPQQCEIPEDFKLPPTSQSLDVMSFLGIQRAKPLARKEVSRCRRRRVDRTDDE